MIVRQFSFFTSLVIILPLLFFSCTTDQDQSNEHTAETISEEDLFAKQLEILKKVDQCNPEDRELYSEQTVFFHPLIESDNSSFLVVESYCGCGFTGSCGNRIMVIQNDSLLIWDECGFLDSVSSHSTRFYSSNRGYETGRLNSVNSWNGSEFESELLSRNDIPLPVLRQINLKECEEKDFYYDCYSLNYLELDTLALNEKGDEGLLVKAPHYILEESEYVYDNAYWLFFHDGPNKNQLINAFEKVDTMVFNQKEVNGFYSITIEGYDEDDLPFEYEAHWNIEKEQYLPAQSSN
jgi:hypothetical protein